MNRLTEHDFAESFGIPVSALSEECKKRIHETDFSYRILEGEEREREILAALKRIDNDTQIVGAPERTEVWQNGWNENLQKLKDAPVGEAVMPGYYFKKEAPLRWKQQFIKSENPLFEYEFYRIFKLWLFQTYLNPCRAVYEFGSGSGMNLLEMAQLFPEKDIYGLDFVPAAVEIVDQLKNKMGGCCHSLHGRLFDMISPDYSFTLEQDSVILTLGALEQLAGKFEHFISYLIQNKPQLCIHMEPTIELYDTDQLIDYLAYKFHHKRGYTEGLLPHIQALAEQGQAELIKVKRMYFGNLNMEGYTMIIWRPL